MPSLYLGKIGSKQHPYEIHALTQQHAFREIPSSDIADPALFEALLKGRYQVLESQRPIYCTAVQPDVQNKLEYNPHDNREGTVHFVALNPKGDISCALSVAVDIGKYDQEQYIGLPLENRWRPGNFEAGQNLDDFRNNYFPKNYQIDKTVAPWKMAELYRHYKIKGTHKSLADRLGVYTGCYHLLVREARKHNKTETSLWVFDAIPAYFNLYKYAGAAVLRDFTIQSPTNALSPGPTQLLQKKEALYFKQQKVSRQVEVPIPTIQQNQIQFDTRKVPFLDGVVDVHKFEYHVQKAPLTLGTVNTDGFTLKDHFKLRYGSSIIAHRMWSEDLANPSFLTRQVNQYIKRSLNIDILDFNEIGQLKNL